MQKNFRSSPYSLLDDSETYFIEVARLADHVTNEAQRRMGGLLNSVQTLNAAIGWLPQGQDEERIVEMLTIGVFWNNYGDYSMALGRMPQKVLSLLSRVRRKHRFTHLLIDPLRGLLGGSTLFGFGVRKHTPSLFHLEQLEKWLQATGIFESEASRIHGWRMFLGQLSEESLSSALSALIEFAWWFEEMSETVLRPYTRFAKEYSQVTGMRSVSLAGFMQRRRPADYHLNLVGAVLLNRAYREEFQAALHKQVLVPGCMRNPGTRTCNAKFVDGSLRCAGCSEGCMVKTLTRMGESHGFSVRIVPHASTALPEAEVGRATREGVAVVGVACALHLIGGGWMVRDKGLAAQCVPLNCSGCKKWLAQPAATSFDLSELLQVLDTTESKESGHHGEESALVSR